MTVFIWYGMVWYGRTVRTPYALPKPGHSCALQVHEDVMIPKIILTPSMFAEVLLMVRQNSPNHGKFSMANFLSDLFIFFLLFIFA